MTLSTRLLLLSAAALLAGCTCANDTNIENVGGGGHSSSGGGSGGGGGKGGGGGGKGGGTGGGGASVGGGSGGGSARDAGLDAGFIDDGGSFEPPDDAGMNNYDGGCGPIDAGSPPFPRKCAPATTSECSAATDAFLTARGVGAALLNAQLGNGYDDDCDGEVDEGCACPGNGQTRDCYLVPATQANPATKQPVGWCLPNAKGSLDCAGGELPFWSGVCRGANPPARHDTCGAFDFNCDGLNGNSDLTGCNCPTQVVCPTQELTFAPFPSPTAIPLVDGSAWIMDPLKRAAATNWTWTALGGDCDNVLPFPTFALYSGADSTVASARKGIRTPVKFDQATAKYVALANEPLIAIQAANYGAGVAGGQLHPAFALSGDYTVQGEFDLAGTHYVCTQKVRVRAPGVRAELCWDTVGGVNSNGNDIDLHFARLQGTSCPNKGWDTVCSSNSLGLFQDCYYHPGSGCPSTGTPPGWGYTDSLTSACHGWGSKRGTSSACTNPRLDRDNVSCDRSVSDPDGPAYCGPENINIDNPKDNDSFVVGVNHFANHGGTSDAKPHVNLYCNGARVLSVGFNPATGQTGFPLLTKGGSDTNGDFWTAAQITAHLDGGQLASCDVTTMPSRHADPTRDGPPAASGGTSICVDSVNNLSPPPDRYNYASHKFVEAGSGQGVGAGSQPTTAAQWCKH